MAPSSCIELTFDDIALLLGLARRSIEQGQLTGHAVEPDPDEISGSLTQQLGSFVTLTNHGKLRGCVGSVRPDHPLAHNVAIAAFNAAYRDNRFPPLPTADFAQTRIEISVLSPLDRIDARSNAELLANLRPHEDGLLIEAENQHATFLPQVWEKISAPHDFVRQLKIKAGLPGDYWSESIRCYRYRTTSIAEEPGTI